MNIPKIFFSFAIVIIVAISSAIFTIMQMQKLSTNTQKMYTHPFQVSNAVSNIQTSIVAMHRNMKDIILTKHSFEMIKIIESIQTQEENVYVNFKLIYKNYLGNKQDIDASFKAFKDWKGIREEVISLVHEGKVDEATTITKGKGANHIQKLYEQINVLKKYAFNKADEFYTSSIKDNGVEKVIIIFVLTLIFSGLVVIYIIFNLLKIAKVNKKQLHLIDQNILMATFNLDKKVIDISSALCRVLNQPKKYMINSTNNYFFTTKAQYELFENKIYSSQEHKGELSININDEDTWFSIEIFPELDHDFQLSAFTVFLTNISDKKKIEEVSITDTLTGLYNRNYFEMIFEKEVKRSKRDNKPLSMLMLDIDYFKQFNDTYGHQEGDNALKAVSHILSAHTNRSYDYAFRVGGEEFVILSYQKDYEMLEEFAITLIQEIESLKISHKLNTTSNYLTASAGVMMFGEKHLLNTDDMYKVVDGLLYDAKADGRNTFKSSYMD